jgi:cytidine diphosphoramidate kinase
MVIWIVGLSGAGKTTIGKEVYSQIKNKYLNTVFLDGDEIRKVLQNDNGGHNYSIEGRKLNAERIIALCKVLDSQGINVVCSILCIFPDLLEENKSRFTKYIEVFADAPMTVLKNRDYKDLYRMASKGIDKNVVGVNIDFPRPKNPDLILDTSSLETFERNIQLVMEVFNEKRSK